jgi:arginine deiminase
MKLELDAGYVRSRSPIDRTEFRVAGESDRLGRVLLCAPHHLEPVPCCSVTRESLRAGFASDKAIALRQHRTLAEILAANGVAVELLRPAPGLPDLCFTRDVGVSTPWGLVALNPALAHRAAEVAQFKSWAQARSGSPTEQITAGTIEGGDICIARPGLLIVGVSGHRTDRAGAEAFAAPFRADGWDVLLYEFDEHFLHLDTIFSMLNPGLALGCTEVLDDGFIAALARRGIDLLPVTYKEARKLGCNVLSLDGHKVIAGSSTPRVSEMMRAHGLDVIEADLSQFQACGGGVHCLTMPLERGQA